MPIGIFLIYIIVFFLEINMSKKNDVTEYAHN